MSSNIFSCSGCFPFSLFSQQKNKNTEYTKINSTIPQYSSLSETIALSHIDKATTQQIEDAFKPTFNSVRTADLEIYIKANYKNMLGRYKNNELDAQILRFFVLSTYYAARSRLTENQRRELFPFINESNYQEPVAETSSLKHIDTTLEAILKKNC